MRYRCKDCGTPNFEPSERGDVCSDCMELRGKFMGAVSDGTISRDLFMATQHTMNYSRWKGAGAMREALAIIHPPGAAKEQ